MISRIGILIHLILFAERIEYLPRPLTQEYAYPRGDAMHIEQAIQEYFNEIAIPIEGLYRDVGDTNNYFGSPSIIRPTLDQRRIVQPDIIHMIYKSDIAKSRNYFWDR